MGLLKCLLFLFFFVSLSTSKNWLEAIEQKFNEGERYCWAVGNKNLRANYFVATNQRDEEHLSEWVSHHLILGFDGVLIFDDFSKDPVGFLSAIPEEERKKVLVFLRCPNGTFVHKTHIQRFVANIAGNYGGKWVMHLDADEFLALNPKKAKNLESWLGSFETKTRQVACNWLMYGSGFRDKIDPSELMLNAYTYREPNVRPHVKCLQKPPVPPFPTWRPVNAHYMAPAISLKKMKKLRRGGDLNFTRKDGVVIDMRSVLGNGGFWEMWPRSTVPNQVLEDQTCVVSHYFVQSLEACYQRKILRPRDDIPEYRSSLPEDVKEICNHDLANQVEDPERMGMYGKRVEKFLVPVEKREKLEAEKMLDGFLLESYKGSTMYIHPQEDLHSTKKKRMQLQKYKKALGIFPQKRESEEEGDDLEDELEEEEE